MTNNEPNVEWMWPTYLLGERTDQMEEFFQDDTLRSPVVVEIIKLLDFGDDYDYDDMVDGMFMFLRWGLYNYLHRRVSAERSERHG